VVEAVLSYDAVWALDITLRDQLSRRSVFFL
jgi:hypothetical protein